MPPNARVSDMTICPLFTPVPFVGLVPHVGGPIIGPGAFQATINGLPAACVGDMCYCNLSINTIATGSFKSLIRGRPAARFGDMTAHGGFIITASPSSMG